MNKDIFMDKNSQEAIQFYYSTRGVYKAKFNILKEEEIELANLLEFKDSNKKKIAATKKRIEKIRIEIETIEKLYKIAFD